MQIRLQRQGNAPILVLPQRFEDFDRPLRVGRVLHVDTDKELTARRRLEERLENAKQTVGDLKSQLEADDIEIESERQRAAAMERKIVYWGAGNGQPTLSAGHIWRPNAQAFRLLCS